MVAHIYAGVLGAKELHGHELVSTSTTSGFLPVDHNQTVRNLSRNTLREISCTLSVEVNIALLALLGSYRGERGAYWGDTVQNVQRRALVNGVSLVPVNSLTFFAGQTISLRVVGSQAAWEGGLQNTVSLIL